MTEQVAWLRGLVHPLFALNLNYLLVWSEPPIAPLHPKMLKQPPATKPHLSRAAGTCALGLIGPRIKLFCKISFTKRFLRTKPARREGFPLFQIHLLWLYHRLVQKTPSETCEQFFPCSVITSWRLQ